MTRLGRLFGPGRPPAPPAALLPGVAWRELKANLLVSGRTGAGKTTLVTAALRWAAARRLGITVTAPKPGDGDALGRLFARAGRADVTVVAPGGAATLNLLADLPCPPGLDLDTRAVVLADVLQAQFDAVGRLDAGRGGDDAMWAAGGRSFTRHACGLLLYADEPVTPARLLDCLRTSAPDRAALGTPGWRDGYNAALLERAFRRHAGRPAEAGMRAVADWWTVTRVGYPERQAAGYLGQIYPSLELLAGGTLGRLLGDPAPAVRLPEHVARGGVLIVDAPVATYKAVGVALQRGVLSGVQQACLARAAGPGTVPHVVCVDEYATVAAADDALFLSLSRSSLAVSLLATQCAVGLRRAFPGDAGEATAASITGNCATHLVCRPTPDTAEAVCRQQGSAVRTLFTGGTAGDAYPDPLSLADQGGRATASWSEAVVGVLEPADLGGLATGDRGVVEYVRLGHGPPRRFSYRRPS